MKTKYSKEEFQIAVMTSESIREVLVKLNLKPIGGNYKVFYKSAKKFNIDVSGFINGTTYGIEKEKRDCITSDMIIKSVKENISLQAILNGFGLNPTSGSNNRWIRTQISKLDLDINHFLGQGHLKKKKHNWNKVIPITEILNAGTDYSSSKLSKRLVKEGLLIYKCSICEIDNWQNKKLTLHLDHVNGINNDNRLENLRLLCPNCHSQTDTYCSKNNRKKVVPEGLEPPHHF